jgi:hypothetical protein
MPAITEETITITPPAEEQPVTCIFVHEGLAVHAENIVHPGMGIIEKNIGEVKHQFAWDMLTKKGEHIFRSV